MNQNLVSEKNKNFFLVKIFLVISVTVLLISSIHFARKLNNHSEIKSLIAQIKKYDAAINSFTIKYQALPGDTENTEVYGITEENTDGNFDNSITDINQNITSANGEITNFWLHLSSSKMLDEKYNGKTNNLAISGKTFPLSNLGKKVGIIAYSFAGKTFYQIGFDFADEQRIYTKENSLESSESFLFDKKVDDGNPFKGNVVIAGGDALNLLKNDKCANFDEYNLSTKNPVCQLRIEIR